MNGFSDQKSNIKPNEWRWALGWSLFVLLLSSLPYLYGFALSTPANVFGGFVIGLEDGNSYLAKMEEGRAGHWLFYLAYTPEPHAGALFFLYYLGLGQLSRLLGLEPLLLLHLSRMVTVPFGLLSFYRFAAYFSPKIGVRRLAFLLFGLGSGLGWLWLLLGYPAELGAMPVDLWVPDANFFLSALTFPHLPLAQGLLLWVALAGLQFLERGRRNWGLIAAGAGLLVSLIHPYTLPIQLLLLGLYWLGQHYSRPRLLAKGFGRLALVAAPALPYLLYVLVVFETNPAFKAWRSQSLTLSPHPRHYLLGFGLLLPLVGLGLWRAGQSLTKQARFLLIWLLVIPWLLYLPIPLQRRFLDGYQAPVTAVGAVGLVWLAGRLRKGRVLASATLLLLLALTNLFLVLGGLLVVSGREAPIFHAGSQQAAFGWLAQQPPAGVVLAAYQSGNLLPAYAPVRVFVGHGPETVRSDEKRQQLRKFFATQTSQAWRRELLATYRVDYLFYGPRERALGGFEPARAPYLQPVYNNETVQIYRVTID